MLRFNVSPLSLILLLLVPLGEGENVDPPSAEETGLPEIISDIDQNVTSFAKLWGWNGCSGDEKKAVLGGLQDAHDLLKSDGSFS